MSPKFFLVTEKFLIKGLQINEGIQLSFYIFASFSISPKSLLLLGGGLWLEDEIQENPPFREGSLALIVTQSA